MNRELILVKLENLKEIFDELKEQYEFYKEQKNGSFLQKTSFYAIQKKLEEVIEYSIKINKILLKEKNVFVLSYQDSFVKLEKIGFSKEISKKFSKLAFFRNRLAHEYLVVTEEETISSVEFILENFSKYIGEVMNFLKNN